MLQRLCHLVHTAQHQQQVQHVLLPLLQQFQQQLTLVQQAAQLPAPFSSCGSSNLSNLVNLRCHSSSTSGRHSSSFLSRASTLNSSGQCNSSSACSSWVSPLWHTQLVHYSQRASKLNPKERKAQQKTDKRALKKSAVPQGTASAADSATSFEEDMQTVEADVTKLVLQAIHNITPVLDVRTVRSATTVKYVPGLMPPRKARSLALHWLVRAADARKKSSSASYAECLALELLLAYQKRGGARQKRDDLHKLALQNRANVHMRWW